MILCSMISSVSWISWEQLSLVCSLRNHDIISHFAVSKKFLKLSRTSYQQLLRGPDSTDFDIPIPHACNPRAQHGFRLDALRFVRCTIPHILVHICSYVSCYRFRRCEANTPLIRSLGQQQLCKCVHWFITTRRFPRFV